VRGLQKELGEGKGQGRGRTERRRKTSESVFHKGRRRPAGLCQRGLSILGVGKKPRRLGESSKGGGGKSRGQTASGFHLRKVRVFKNSQNPCQTGIGKKTNQEEKRGEKPRGGTERDDERKTAAQRKAHQSGDVHGQGRGLQRANGSRELSNFFLEVTTQKTNADAAGLPHPNDLN